MAMLSSISAGTIFLLAACLASCSQAHPISAISAQCTNHSVDTLALKNEIRQSCRNIESSCENIHNTLLGFDKEVSYCLHVPRNPVSIYLFVRYTINIIVVCFCSTLQSDFIQHHSIKRYEVMPSPKACLSSTPSSGLWGTP